MKNKSILLFIASVICLASCQKDTREEQQQVAAEAKVILDAAYGGNPFQKMDVYLPANRTAATPVIIVLHGGAFVAGDKSEFSLQSQALAEKGFAVLNVNYRLVDAEGLLQLPPLRKESAIKISSQLDDIKSAINFASAKAGEWIMASTGWGISGHSAGGTLAMLYAYGETNTDKRIWVAANWAGETDFSFADEAQFQLLDPRITELYQRAVGAKAENKNRLAFMAVSPFWLVNNGSGIPTINIRPEFNVVLNMPDASKPRYQVFTDVINAKNVPNKYIEVTGADHNFSKPGNWELVLNETVAFFEEYLD